MHIMQSAVCIFWHIDYSLTQTDHLAHVHLYPVHAVITKIYA